MATTRIFSRRSRGLSCEIASDLCPNPLSHDWHVQPSCQRPNRTPPERRAFSPSELAQVRIRPSSKPYKHTVRRKTLSIRASHRISTAFPQREMRAGELKPTRSRFLTGLSGPIRNDSASDAAQKRATVWPSASRSAHFGAGLSGRARAEDRKLRKELALEVPCFEGTLQKPTGVSESSPVAGTT